MHKTSIVLSLLWCGCRSLVVPHCGSVLVFQSGFCLCVWHQKVNIFQLEEGVSLQGGVETLKEVSRFTVPADLTWPLWSSAQTCFYFKSNFHIKRFNLTMLSVFSLKFSYHPGPFLYFVFTFCFPPVYSPSAPPAHRLLSVCQQVDMSLSFILITSTSYLSYPSPISTHRFYKHPLIPFQY